MILLVERLGDAKQVYKSSKVDIEKAEAKLEIAEAKLENIPLYQIIKQYKARQEISKAKSDLKLKQTLHKQAKADYKQKQAKLRQLRHEIRSQYKSHRGYVKFFNRVQEAQKMGIDLPKYITDEYAKQKNTYLNSKYTIETNGDRNHISRNDDFASKDVSKFIHEKQKEKLGEVVSKIFGPKEKATDEGR